jgi:hypothetical protein
MAFPVTFRFFTNGFTFRFRELTVSDTMRSFTDCYTFRTIFHFTSLIGTHDLTIGSFTFNITYSIFWFLTTRMAFRRFTDWGTNSIASGIITFP